MHRQATYPLHWLFEWCTFLLLGFLGSFLLENGWKLFGFRLYSWFWGVFEWSWFFHNPTKSKHWKTLKCLYTAQMANKGGSARYKSGCNSYKYRVFERQFIAVKTPFISSRGPPFIKGLRCVFFCHDCSFFHSSNSNSWITRRMTQETPVEYCNEGTKVGPQVPLS